MKTAGLIALLLLTGTQAAPVDLKTGDPAPEIESVDDTGHPWKSEDLFGKRIAVLYFYPASFSGDCSEQAVEYQKHAERLIDKGAVIIGISGDTAKTQAAFKRKYKLGFALLADEKGEVAKRYGVPIGKGGRIKETVDGEWTEIKRDVTIDRWTFVIGRDGKVAYRNAKVAATNDAAEVFKVISKLQ